ncbi:alpha/beta fold hydrolase [Schumannella luteola]
MTPSLVVHRVPTSLGTLSVRVGGEGRPAVFWHGMFIDSTTWQPVLDVLDARRTIILVDGPGHGVSAPLPRVSSIEESAAVAVEVLDALGIREPVDWVGNAWGGHVGLRLAADHPERVRSLVAVGSPTEPVTEAARGKLRLLLAVGSVIGLNGPARSAVLGTQLTDASRRDPAIMSIVTRALDRARSVLRAVRSFILGRTELTSALPAIAAPTLLVVTDDRDDWTPADASAAEAALPNARTALVTGARTLVPLERPVELARVIDEFWSGLGER